MSKIEIVQLEASSTNGNLVISPNGTGVLEVEGKNDDATLQLNDSQQINNVKIKSPSESSAQNYTLTLPSSNITQDQYLHVDSITGSGSTAVGQLGYAALSAPDLSQLNASNLTSGTVPSARYSLTGTSGAGLKLVSRQFVSTSNSIYQIAFTGLEANTMYRIIAPFVSFGPDTNAAGSPYATAELWMNWAGSNAVNYNNIMFNVYKGDQGYSSNSTSATNINLELGQATNQYSWQAELYTGNPDPSLTDVRKPWMYHVGSGHSIYGKNECWATMPTGSSNRIHQIKYSANNGVDFWENTEILLFKYQEN